MKQWPDSIRNWKWTILTGGLGIGLLCCGLLLNLDLYETIDAFLKELDYLELDEMLLILGPVAVGLTIDMLRARHQKQQEMRLLEQHLETLGATLRMAQDIINNFLNSIQLYILKAQERHLSDEDTQKLDELIQSTTRRLSELEQPLQEDCPDSKGK